MLSYNDIVVYVMISTKQGGEVNVEILETGSATRPRLDMAIQMTRKTLMDVVERFKEHLFLLGFSGGKDSAVMLHLVINLFEELGVKDYRVFFIEVTGNTHEENIKYVYRFVEKLGIPKSKFVHLKHQYDFYELIMRWGFPTYKRRWCMTVFKRNVLLEYTRSLDKPVVVFTGDRLTDSNRRKKLLGKRGIIEYNEYWKQYTVHPIAHWTINEIFNYMTEYSLELNPLYNVLGASGNCVYCPFITRAEYYKKLKEHYPKWYDKIVYAESNLKFQKGAFLIRGKVYTVNELVLNSTPLL